MEIRVSELIVRYLERLGIEYIFGMPGAHILPVYDSLYGSRVKSVLAKHEQGAAFMAGGYSRATGRIAACITTAGPGATNLVTGIANAYADKQPVLIITGETSTHIFGRGGLQESSGEGGSIDQGALFKGITKYNRIVERTDYLASVLNQASKTLLGPNPGPVLLSFPFNVQKEMVEEAILEQVVTQRASHSVPKTSLSLDPVIELILQARHPVIVAGYGCIKSGAQALLRDLCQSLCIPVATSLKGRGVVDESSELALGSLGVTSDGQAFKHIAEYADLVLFLGAGFNERTSYLWDTELLSGKKIVQVDIDHGQLEKVFKADIAVIGDIRDILQELAAGLAVRGARKKPALPDTGHCHRPERATLELWSDFPLVERFFRRLEAHFPDEIVIFDDNIIFAQNFFNASPGSRYYPNSGISSLGHAIPAAIGARFAVDKPTFAILGDGGFQMCCMEIMTAVNYRLPLNVILFNNASMGLIRKNQSQQYGGRFIDCDFVNPDYRHLARSFGIDYHRIESEADLDDLFSGGDFSGRINLVEIIIDKNAFPQYASKR